MKFCANCSNMYYLSISEENANELTYHCRNCGNTESMQTETVCISRATKTDTGNFKNIVNKYTKLDPTLPRISKIHCVNAECPTNTEEIPREIILIRYDNSKMKYLYLCSTCDSVWKTDDTKSN